MFMLAEVQDEVVADIDGVGGVEEKASEPSLSLACCLIRGAAQADLRSGSSAAVKVVSVLEGWWRRRLRITIAVIFNNFSNRIGQTHIPYMLLFFFFT